MERPLVFLNRYRGVIEKVMVPFVSGAPALALQRAPRAACSHARLMDASAPPLALAEITRPSESITTFTVTVTLWRSATSGLGHPLKLRPEAIPLMPVLEPPAPLAALAPSVTPLRLRKPLATFDVTRFFSSSESVGSVLFTALSRFDATFFRSEERRVGKECGS